mgnify:CR=1 FL=1
MTGLNWDYIWMGAAIPPCVAVLFAFPFWWKEQPIFGNLVGTGVLFGACLDAGIPCFPDPPAFTRYAIYAFIALIQVILLFSFSLKVEQKRRRRGYAPEWR